MKTAFFFTAFFASYWVNAQPKNNIPGDNISISPTHRRNNPTKHFMPTGTVKWKFKTRGKIFSSPAIVKGAAFIGSEDGNLYCIDVRSGKQKWVFKTGGPVHSSPLISGSNVFFGSFDGHYYAVDRNTGKQKWKLKTGGERAAGGYEYWGMKLSGVYMNDLWDLFLSSPVADKDPGGSTILYFGSSDSNLYAVDANNGSLKWKFKTNGLIHSSPALDNGTVYIGSWDSYFYAIDSQTGKEKWRFKTGKQ